MSPMGERTRDGHVTQPPGPLTARPEQHGPEPGCAPRASRSYPLSVPPDVHHQE